MPKQHIKYTVGFWAEIAEDETGDTEADALSDAIIAAVENIDAVQNGSVQYVNWEDVIEDE